MKNKNKILLRDGEIDDIFIEATYFRMERMDNKTWWIGVYDGDKRICFSVYSKKRINIRISEDELDCEYENTDTNTGEKIPFEKNF